MADAALLQFECRLTAAEGEDMKPKKKKMGARAAERRKLLLISIPFLLFITAFCYVPLAGWVI